MRRHFNPPPPFTFKWNILQFSGRIIVVATDSIVLNIKILLLIYKLGFNWKYEFLVWRYYSTPDPVARWIDDDDYFQI